VRAVDLGAVADVEDVEGAGVFVDPVDDPAGAAPGSMTAGQRAEQRFADPVRVDRQGGLAEFQHSSTQLTSYRSTNLRHSAFSGDLRAGVSSSL
jgi:hypothetical protein